MSEEPTKPVFDAAAARAVSYADPDASLKAALERIEQSAKKGWTSVALDGPGWREAGEFGDGLREQLLELSFGVMFDPAARSTRVTW